MTTTVPLTASTSPAPHSFSSSMRRLASRTGPITSNDKSTAVMVTTWSTLGLVVAVVILRQAIRYLRRKRTNLDDVFVLLATTFAIGLSVTTLILASEGLGVRGELTKSQADIQMKAHYASDFLYVLSICFPKLALISFFHGVVVQRAERRITQIFGIFVIAWTLASLAAVAFQCSLPRPWEMMTLRCYNKGVFWIVYCIIDMTSEVGIVMLSVNLVAYLRVKLSRKLIIVACFAPRVLVVGAALTRLVFLYPIMPGSKTTPFNLWVPVVCTQIHVCVSIATACIPYIKPIFEGLLVPGSHPTNQHYVQGHKKGGAAGGAHDDMYSFDSAPSLNYSYGGVGAVKRSAGAGAGAGVGTGVSGRTPDISPRVPSLAPLSPLTPPRYVSPSQSHPNSPATPKSRSPSERGLKLHIPQGAFINTSKFPSSASQTGICTIEITPPQNQHHVGHAHPQSALTSDIVSPQTASSHTFSPGAEGPDGIEGLSPQPLLAGFQPQSLTPPLPSKTIFPRIPRSSNSQVPQIPQNSRASKVPKVPRIPSASYSLIPQITPIPPPTIPAIPASRHRPTSTIVIPKRRSLQAKEQRKESQGITSPVQSPILDVDFPPRLSSKQAHAHPLHRYRAHYAASASGSPSNTQSPISPTSTPISPPAPKPWPTAAAPTSVPEVPPPLPRKPKFSTAPDPKKPSPTVTIPTYYVRTTSSPLSPPTGRNTGSTLPSYYMNTPPTTSPPTFPLPSPPLQSPLGPGSRIRNQRILEPANTSRSHPAGNVAWQTGSGSATVRSPISPLTATTISPITSTTPRYNAVPTRTRSGRGRFPVRPSSTSGDAAAAAMHTRRRTGTINSVTSPVSSRSRDPIVSPNSSRMRGSRPWANEPSHTDRESYISEEEVLMRAGSDQVRVRNSPAAQGRRANAQDMGIGYRGRWERA